MNFYTYRCDWCFGTVHPRVPKERFCLLSDHQFRICVLLAGRFKLTVYLVLTCTSYVTILCCRQLTRLRLTAGYELFTVVDA